MNALDLASRLHLKRLPNGSWRGACPACGYAGTFSLRQADGATLWWCASCQDRDGVTAAVRDAGGGDWTPPPPRQAQMPSGPSPARRTALAMALWNEAMPLAGTPAEAYLRTRGVLGAWQALPMPPEGAQLRFHPSVTHPEADGRLPAMLALIRRASDGEPIALHRTYLTHDGAGKAAVVPQKATLGPMAGGVVMLHQPQATQALVLAEGIETALSAAALMGMPAWAAVSAGNLANLALPALPDLIVAADADLPGQRDAWAAAQRWRGEGRRVQVATPEQAGTDFNDALMARQQEAEHGR